MQNGPEAAYVFMLTACHMHSCVQKKSKVS